MEVFTQGWMEKMSVEQGSPQYLGTGQVRLPTI